MSGTRKVGVTAADDSSGVSQASPYVDGKLLASDGMGPYSFYWDTTGTSNGGHTLTAHATDGAGNLGTSDPVTVSVSNTPDSTAPTVVIASLVYRHNKWRVAVNASASSDSLTFNINIQRLRPGTHILEARAYDAAGNRGVSAPVAFTR